MTLSPDKPKLRRLRVSLRTLLVLLAVGCVWLGWTVNRVHQQRRTVQWVKELGGSVTYDYENTVNYVGPPGPDWLRVLIGIDYFANVVVVDLSDSQVRDVTPLANLHNLEELWLYDTPVRDVKPLATLKSLKSLHLHGSQVTKEDCKMLQKSLRMLNIR